MRVLIGDVCACFCSFAVLLSPRPLFSLSFFPFASRGEDIDETHGGEETHTRETGAALCGVVYDVNVVVVVLNEVGVESVVSGGSVGLGTEREREEERVGLNSRACGLRS